MRGLILALQFLTRIPTPTLSNFASAELPRSAIWFPLVGLIIGASLSSVLWLGSLLDPWLGALLTLLLWVWITGGLHLDGLADMSDALGAIHRDKTRFLAVLEDPHLGTFGVLSLILQLLSKLILLMLLAKNGQALALLLIPAWARWGCLIWARLPSLKPGLGERFGWAISRNSILILGIFLILLSFISPALFCAILLILLWRHYLLQRFGGMTGDLLGAGIEVVETQLLLVVLVPRFANQIIALINT
jgi:adenosylcobinamide-GDP ribazoletransferase